MAAERRGSDGARLVELVGVAGVGKSTMLKTVPAADPTVRVGQSLWGLPKSLLAMAAVELVPTIVAAAFTGHALRPSEIGQMIRITALRRALERTCPAEPCTMLIDEGPVFGLAWLEVFHPAQGDPWRRAWRSREREHWARRLHGVVRMDAPDRELARRIRAREKEHMVKDRSDEEIGAFMTRFRAAYDEVLADMAGHGLPRIDHVPAEGEPGEAMARVRLSLQEVARGN